MRLNKSYLIKQLLLMASIFLLTYLGNQQVQAWLGQRAIERTGFEEIDFDSALAKANSEGKQVLVNFAAIWCVTCRRLDNQVLSLPGVKEQIDANYVFTRLEYTSDDRKYFQNYEVDRFPTLMILDSEGKTLRRITPTLKPEDFVKQL